MANSESSTTTTITVYTRHSAACAKQTDPQWRNCKCRKYLYVYENGVARRVSAKTRVWGTAEKLAKAELAKRDPAERALQAIKDRDAAREAARNKDRVTIAAALAQWLKSRPKGPASTHTTHLLFAEKVQRWATAKKLEYLDEITKRMLAEWHGEWKPEAKRPDDRMAPTTASHFNTRLKGFFAWAVDVADLIETNPAKALPSIQASDKRTWPLTPEQFNELLAACARYDETACLKKHKFGRHLRALFLLMRWSGLRVTDCLALPRRALGTNCVTLITQKTKAQVSPILPPDVVEALASLPRLTGISDDYFFWPRQVSLQALKATWLERINRLRPYLSFQDEDGQPLEFHSHMLRDTFAVELLKAGWSLEDVSRLLTHTSIRVTEKYYARWVKARVKQLDDKMIAYLASRGAEGTGATFTA
ncbi:MAG: site-specific integrase [Terracidiphilus sp.]|jgi:integrase